MHPKVEPFQKESVLHQNYSVELVSSVTQECDAILSLDCAFSRVARTLLFDLKFCHCTNKYCGTLGSNKYGLCTTQKTKLTQLNCGLSVLGGV